MKEVEFVRVLTLYFGSVSSTDTRAKVGTKSQNGDGVCPCKECHLNTFLVLEIAPTLTKSTTRSENISVWTPKFRWFFICAKAWNQRDDLRLGTQTSNTRLRYNQVRRVTFSQNRVFRIRVSIAWLSRGEFGYLGHGKFGTKSHRFSMLGWTGIIIGQCCTG